VVTLLSPEAIRRARHARGLAQVNVATHLGVRQTAVSDYETGKSVVPGDKLAKLADLLGVRVDQFFIRVPTAAGA